MRRFLSAGLSVLVSCCLLLVLPQAAAAAPTSAQIDGLISEVIAEWVPKQDELGRLRDPRNDRYEGGYGQAMFAYAMLRMAHRTGDTNLAAAANRLIATQFDPKGTGGFEQTAMTTIWLDPRTRGQLTAENQAGLVATLRGFARAVVGERAQACQERPDCYNNLKLVDATASLLLFGDPALRAGATAGSKLANGDAELQRARQTVLGVEKTTYRDGHLGSASGRFARPVVASDPSTYPLAYHHLTTFFMQYAQVADPSVLGRSSRLDEFDRSMLQASLALTGPDGDITYMGRGQRQVWSTAAAFAAAMMRARDELRLGRTQTASRLFGQVDLLWPSLIAARANAGGGGLAVTPANSPEGTDHYASQTTYVGLALFFLSFASDAREPITAQVPAIPIPSRAGNMVWSDPSATGLTVLRRDGVWLAFKRAVTHRVDARYDVGLLALKMQRQDGSWADVIAPRPITDRPGFSFVSGGPRLADGRVFAARSMQATSKSIRFRGEFVAVGGRARAERVTLTVVPMPGGVKMHWELEQERTVRFTMFERATDQVRLLSARQLRAPRWDLITSRPMALRSRDVRDASAQDARLLRHEISLKARSFTLRLFGTRKNL